MRILNCFHTIADLDLLSEDDWISGSSSGYIDTCYLKQILNCYDESALELSCRVREASISSDISCECTAVTVSDQKAKSFLERMAALGFTGTDLIQLDDASPTENLSSERTAGLLYSYIKKQTSFDFILCGLQSGDGAQGKVPFLLAEYLGIRCISNVTGISPAGDGSLSVISQRDAEICTETVHGPSLLIIGNIANTFLRVPTLRQRMQSRGQKITLYHEAELASSFPEELNPATTGTVRLTNIEPVLQQRDSEIFEEADASKAAGVLFDYYKKWI